MNSEHIKYLKSGLDTAFIDHSISSNLAYKPQFISNSYKEGRKVISSIEEELLACDEFCISVAFITMGGITPLLQTLKELEKRNIPGKILTTDYLTFSEPAALKRLAGLSNIELKMYVTEDGGEGFHTKGYVFRKDEMYRIIVGSSNVTQSALTVNREWNTRIVSTEQGEYARSITKEFQELWNSPNALGFDRFIDRYCERYTKNRIIQKQKELAKAAEIPSLEAYKLQPNSMQVGFITNLRKLYEAERSAAIERLAGVDGEHALDYILSVDIFSEGWEFPGGKIEPGETKEAALIREIREELDAEIDVKSLFDTVEYDYPDFHLTMHCFLCELQSDGLVLKEHEDARWLKREELDTVEWLPADRGLIEKLEQEFS